MYFMKVPLMERASPLSIVALSAAAQERGAVLEVLLLEASRRDLLELAQASSGLEDLGGATLGLPGLGASASSLLAVSRIPGPAAGADPGRRLTDLLRGPELMLENGGGPVTSSLQLIPEGF